MENIMAPNFPFIYDFIYYFSRIGLCIVTIISGPLCWINSIGKRKDCPAIKNPLLLHSATKLAHIVRTRQVTCQTIMRAYISRAEEVNKVVNAIVEERFTEALEEAIELDKKIENNYKTIEEMEKQTPLLGVPITIKESIMVKGMSYNVGQYNTNYRSDRDARAVQLIKNAGAIVIAVTNTPELCLFWETFNNVTGLTKNPYDTRRTVGGSSGGEAALISSGASVIGLGSDLAGSLRLPAFFTGIFSHKPTPNVTSIDGYKPKVHDEHIHDYLVTGPLTRYAEDLPLLMSVLSESSNKKFLNYKQVVLNNINIYYMEKENSSLLAKNVDKNIIIAMKKFANYLKGKYDAKIEKVDIAHLHYSFPLSLEVLLGLEKVESVYLDENLEFHFWAEFFKFITFQSNSTLPMFFYGIIKYLHNILIKTPNPPVYQLVDNIKKTFEDILGDHGIFLYPTFTNPAHYHYSMFHNIMGFSYAAIFNVLGLPVTNCPAGFVRNLPIGFQVVARTNNDELTLAVAQEAEKFFGGWKPPETR